MLPHLCNMLSDALGMGSGFFDRLDDLAAGGLASAPPAPPTVGGGFLIVLPLFYFIAPLGLTLMQ